MMQLTNTRSVISLLLSVFLLLGCLGGPVTPNDFSYILASLREAFQLYQEISEALEDARDEDQEEEKIETLSARLEEALESFIYWRERLSNLNSAGKQKAQEFKVTLLEDL